MKEAARFFAGSCNEQFCKRNFTICCFLNANFLTRLEFTHTLALRLADFFRVLKIVKDNRKVTYHLCVILVLYNPYFFFCFDYRTNGLHILLVHFKRPQNNSSHFQRNENLRTKSSQKMVLSCHFQTKVF